MSVNPGQTALGRGLTSWAKFGLSVSGSRVSQDIIDLNSGLGRVDRRIFIDIDSQHSYSGKFLTGAGNS